ncbi:hypothetical protein V1520DRAFT_347381 [Lipomyces starkeyi]|uniref:Uncharacterized protein n=1 Tax=Lipomyces starkeyi NRRL Y-11557 TaxID=675824 RepID=A0A1E3QEX7_LIPST|nr:hypothetical protein LIPSTDRAFT_67134 [Lipomyces starkeyi NRRL Y-11557]
MPVPTDSHPLQSSDSPDEPHENLELSDAPGSPIIADFHDALGANNNEISGAESSAAIDLLEYDEDGDENQSLLHPQPRLAHGRHLFRNSILTNSKHSTERASSPTYTEDSLDSATEADLLLPSPSSASSIREYFKKRWGTFFTRLLAYALFGIVFIIGWKLVFLPRTTLRRDLARLRHFQVSLSDLERTLFGVPETSKVREWSHYYTSGAHLAGTNYSQVQWTADKFKEYGFTAEIVSYETYLNYPRDHSLKLLDVHGTIRYEAPLKEDMLTQDPTTNDPNSVPTFHGYSANGNVTAAYVYVNYGRQEDYDLLEERGIDISGKIVIARYGGLFRGLIVKGAQERGAVGALLYTDPGDDGDITLVNKYRAYPDGPARNPSSVQRGSVLFLSSAPGDPTTPGFASKPGAERVDPHERIPSIPSLPISYRDVLPLLIELNGMGLNPNDLGESWRGGLREYDYSTGPSTMDVNLYNAQDYKTTPIWNAIGRIDGVIKDEVVILGNHRDAWIVGGAGDPNSGSAVLIELARAFGELKSHGWKPLRSIVLASWDGEEYGLLGSTEWGEDMARYLDANALVYLNVDGAVTGSHFHAAASPLLNTVLQEVMKRVPDPKGGYVYDHWLEETEGRIGNLGSGSDYTVFQDHLGIPSIDFGFSEGSNAVYQYHSNYDSFHWMDKYGDPTWEYHVAMVKIWGLVALQLSEIEVISFDVVEYARSLLSYFNDVKTKISHIVSEDELSVDIYDGFYDCPEIPGSLIRECRYIDASAIVDVDLPDLKLGWWYISSSLRNCSDALDKLLSTATTFDAKSSYINKQYLTDYPWFKGYKKMRVYFQIQGLNSQYRQFERKFLYEGGLDGREWFKHVVFAPGVWTGYAGVTFPGLNEALDARNISNTKRWLDIITERISQAVDLLSAN